MRVELVSKTVGVGRYENLSHEEIIAAVARHGVIKDDNGKLVKYLMDHKHWSPLQHVTFSFRIETSRFIGAQILRHRSLHFQELSQRYDKINDMEALEIRRQAKKNRQSSTDELGKIHYKDGETNLSIAITASGKGLHKEATEKEELAMEYMAQAVLVAYEAYEKAIEAGIAKECARGILPMSSKTYMHVTGTLRDLLAFLNIRMDHHAQKEIREIAEQMGVLMELEMPELFKNINWRNGLFM